MLTSQIKAKFSAKDGHKTARRKGIKAVFPKSIDSTRRLEEAKKSRISAAKDRIKRLAAKKKKSPQKMLPFIRALAESVVVGTTTASFRYNLMPFYPRPGETFVARCDCAPLTGKYLCLSREKSTIRKVRDKHWRDIGVPSPEDYEDLMVDILGGTLDLDKPGILFRFRRCE